MFRFSLVAAGSGILCIAAVAQTGVRTALPMQKAANYGGTFHVATGTWTRSVPSGAALGASDVIYNNTANMGAWISQTDDVRSYQIVDAGRVPSTGSAGSANRDNYNINMVTIGYCISDNSLNGADVLVSIYGSYAPCEDPALHPCAGQFLATGLPGATIINVAAGNPTCWIVGFDLSGGNELCIFGDGDASFDNDADFDSFGFGLEFDPGGLGGYVNSGIDFGPIIAGDRMWTVQVMPTAVPFTGEITAPAGAGVGGCAVALAGGGGGTYYGPAECCVPVLGGNNSTGLDNNDLAWFGFDPVSPFSSACYWFGGYSNIFCAADDASGVQLSANGDRLTFMGLYTVFEADLTTNCNPNGCNDPVYIVPFCEPANNNSTGAPAVLSGTFGSGSGSDLHLDVSGGPLPLAGGTRMLGYYLVGNIAGSGVVISDGIFCLIGAGGSFGRYNIFGTDRNSVSLFNAAGNLENFVSTGGMSGFGYDVPSEVEIAGTLLTTIMPGDTYHFQCWYRDTLTGAGNSNFTNGLSVTFP